MGKFTNGDWIKVGKKVKVYCGGNEHKLPRTIPLPETEANATLISAAPDLLAALQDLTNEISAQYDLANGEDSITERVRVKLLKKAKEAIAKAEGLES